MPGGENQGLKNTLFHYIDNYRLMSVLHLLSGCPTLSFVAFWLRSSVGCPTLVGCIKTAELAKYTKIFKLLFRDCFLGHRKITGSG